MGIDEADIAAGLPAVSVGAVLRNSGPRLLRDSLGPITVFYAVYKLTHGGLLPAVILAATVAIAAFTWERRQGRAGILARLSLGFLLVQAAVGILSRSPILYFAQPVLIDTVLGLVFIGSVPLGRPIIGATAKDAFPFPAEVIQSATFRRVFGRLSLAWGVYFLLRAALRLVVLRTGRIDSIVLINVLSDVPVVVSLMIFTTWYSVRGFRRSEEWGPRLAERAG